MEKKKKKRKRPLAVTIVATGIVLLFLIRAYQVVDPLVTQRVFDRGISAPLFVNGALTPMGSAILTSASYLLLSLGGLIVLIGFLRMRRWSWVVLMAWTGISLTITLINYFYSQPNYLVMASDTIIALALNQADVQRIFGIRMDLGEPVN
jgi:hypothetical protein